MRTCKICGMRPLEYKVVCRGCWDLKTAYVSALHETKACDGDVIATMDDDIRNLQKRLFEMQHEREEIVLQHETSQLLKADSTADPNTVRHMAAVARMERRTDGRWWGVVNSGNALVAETADGAPILFRAKRQAMIWKRRHASSYVVVRVDITPQYGGIGPEEN